MALITMLAIGSAVAKGGAGIRAIQGHNDQVAQARQGTAMMDQYKQRLRSGDKQYKDTQQICATKFGQYDLQMNAADRAASRAWYWTVQTITASKTSCLQGMRLDRALAKSGGRAVAAGKSGRSAQRLDTNIENQFVRNQNILLWTYWRWGDTILFGIQNLNLPVTAYGQVAIAPTKPLPLLEPTQLSGPSTAGRNLVSQCWYWYGIWYCWCPSF